MGGIIYASDRVMVQQLITPISGASINDEILFMLHRLSRLRGPFPLNPYWTALYHRPSPELWEVRAHEHEPGRKEIEGAKKGLNRSSLCLLIRRKPHIHPMVIFVFTLPL